MSERAKKFIAELKLDPKHCVLEVSSFGTTVIVSRPAVGLRELLIEDESLAEEVIAWLKDNGATLRALEDPRRKRIVAVAVRKFACPCCGYPELTGRAYENLPDSVIVRRGLPPYVNYFGRPSYEVCACCGFEFGNEDDPGTAQPVSFEEYLRQWQQGGCIWFKQAMRPADWALDKQLQAAKKLNL